MQPVIFRQGLVRSPAVNRVPGSRPGGRRHSGFTLVEVIVGIVVTAIALTLIGSLFFSAPSRSIEPLLQIRAVEFGQALMEEVATKKFDELTPAGGVPPCTVCTAETALGSEEGTDRQSFDDVDDYNTDYCAPVAATNIDGVALGTGYLMSVCVVYDGDYDGVADANINAKLITISITPPSGSGIASPIVLSAYRSNF